MRSAHHLKALDPNDLCGMFVQDQVSVFVMRNGSEKLIFPVFSLVCTEFPTHETNFLTCMCVELSANLAFHGNSPQTAASAIQAVLTCAAMEKCDAEHSLLKVLSANC